MSLVVRNIMENRFSSAVSKESPTLTELNKTLDMLAKTEEDGQVKQNFQKSILQGLFRKLTPLEGKWLVRLLLMKMGFDLATSSLLNCIHPQASLLLDQWGDLNLV